MRISIEDRGERLHRRLRESLGRAARLRCAEHGTAPVALTIQGREPGRFDSRWTACCTALAQKAAAIVKERS